MESDWGDMQPVCISSCIAGCTPLYRQLARCRDSELCLLLLYGQGAQGHFRYPDMIGLRELLPLRGS